MTDLHGPGFDFCFMCGHTVPALAITDGGICTDCEGELTEARATLDATPIDVSDIPMPDLSGLELPPRAPRLVTLWEVLPCEHGVYGAECDECGMAIGPATPGEGAIMDRDETPRASALASTANAPAR